MDGMNSASPSPSTPSRGVRVSMPVERMRVKGLPAPNRDEIDRLRALLGNGRRRRSAR